MIIKLISPVKPNYYLLKIIGLFAFMLVAASAIVLLQRPQLDSSRVLSDETYRKQEEIERVRLNVVKTIPSLGFNNLLSDWTFLQFIQYYGDGEAREVTGASLSPDYLETIIKYDPRFVRAYLALSSASSIDGGRPDRTVKIMEEGLKHLSPDIADAEYVWIYKGVDELLFLGDNEAAQYSYQKGSEWAAMAGNSRLAESARKTAEFIKNNPDSRQARVSAWFMVLAGTTNQATRDFARKKIEELGGRIVVAPNGLVQMIPPQGD